MGTIPKLENEQSASAYVVLGKADESNLLGSFGVALKFIVKEEGDDLGYDDDYPVENCTITVGDYMAPKGMPSGQFKSVWEQLTPPSGAETQKDMALNFKSTEAAVDNIIATLNMQPAEN